MNMLSAKEIAVALVGSLFLLTFMAVQSEKGKERRKAQK
jgi:hypothetical protein